MQTIKVEIKQCRCDRCGYIWTPRVNSPVKCARCGHRSDSTRVNKTKKYPKASAPRLDSTDTLAASSKELTTND